MSTYFECLRTFVLVAVGLGLVALFMRRRSADLRNLAYRYLLVGAWVMPVIGTSFAIVPGIPVATVSADTVRSLPAWTPPSMMPARAYALRDKPYPIQHKDHERDMVAILVFTLVQIGGIFVYLAPSALGSRRLQRIAQTAVALPSYAGIDVWRATDESLGVPVVYGAPARIVLPADSAKWPASRLEAALLHEAAHVQRRDVLWLNMARTLTALTWWNPALHMLYRAMRASAEQAADDAVIAAGFRPSDYARELLAVSAKASGLNGAALAMVEGEGVGHRIRAILTPNRDRRKTSVALGTAAALLVGAVTLATGSLTTRYRTLTISMPKGAVEGSLVEGRKLPKGDHVEIAAVQEVVAGRSRAWYPQGFGTNVDPPAEIPAHFFKGRSWLFIHATVEAASPGDRSFKVLSPSGYAWGMTPVEVHPSTWDLRLWTDRPHGPLSADFAVGVASGPRTVERFAIDPTRIWNERSSKRSGDEQIGNLAELPARLYDLDCSFAFRTADGRRIPAHNSGWFGVPSHEVSLWADVKPGTRPVAVEVAHRPYEWTAFRDVHLEANRDVPWRTVEARR